MELKYLIRIDADKAIFKNISGILDLVPTRLVTEWELEIDIAAHPNQDNSLTILDKMDKKLSELKQLGITTDHITFWCYYEYDDLCNLEFEPELLKKLGSMNITMCVSCWKKDSFIHL